jgi:hypothetical protein
MYVSKYILDIVNPHVCLEPCGFVASSLRRFVASLRWLTPPRLQEIRQSLLLPPR